MWKSIFPLKWDSAEERSRTLSFLGQRGLITASPPMNRVLKHSTSKYSSLHGIFEAVKKLIFA